MILHWLKSTLMKLNFDAATSEKGSEKVASIYLETRQ